MASSTILSRKIIKPSSPTPPSLRHHNLSFADHIAVPQYAPMAFFYSKPENYTNITEISDILENSLSKILSSYYPFAGEIVDNKYVDCNDIGAEYLNVRVNCPMSEILNNRYNDVVDVVFPQDLPWSNSLANERSVSLLVVQLSHFDCGGLAVGVCLSHKIADGYSLCKFLNDWADTARDDQLDFKLSPQFDGASFFPLVDIVSLDMPNVEPEPQQYVSRMYNLSSSSLGRLKDIVALGSQVQITPTRVEVVTALLHKCGVAASMANSGAFRPTILSHVMNLRPPIPLDTIGNACCYFGSLTMTEDEIKLPDFVVRLQMAKQQLRDELKDMNIDQLASAILKKLKEGAETKELDIFDFYFCSSLCNTGIYKTDFGWGRPVRVTLAKYPMKNHLVVMDEPNGDGINVLITLRKVDMLTFQSNKDLLEFASPVCYS